MDGVTEWIMENKDKIEKGVEILGKGCEILAATVGQFHPVLEAFFMVSAELLGNPDGSEAKYLAEQFESVDQKLDKVQSEINKTELVLKRSTFNMQYFTSYTQIINQYEMFKYIFKAKPEYKKQKVEDFLKNFEICEGDKNLEYFYGEITKNEDAMLDTILVTEQRSRRAVEEFCAFMKKVFVVGIISLMGYTALTDRSVRQDIVKKKWQDRMENVEKRMKAAVDECVSKFAEQAKTDFEQNLKEIPSSLDPEYPKSILDALVKKYDWVSWSVRVFKDDDMFRRGKCHHIISEPVKYFEHLDQNKINIVVSFTDDPKPLDKVQIKDQIEKEQKGNIQSMAESLSKSFPKCLVHAVKLSSSKLNEANKFNPEHFYYIHHKKASICLHSI